jgi:hypothetical protein
MLDAPGEERGRDVPPGMFVRRGSRDDRGPARARIEPQAPPRARRAFVGPGDQRASHPSAAGTRPGKKAAGAERCAPEGRPRNHCRRRAEYHAASGTGPFPKIRQGRRKVERQGSGRNRKLAIRTALLPAGRSPITATTALRARPSRDASEKVPPFRTRTSKPAAFAAFAGSPPRTTQRRAVPNGNVQRDHRSRPLSSHKTQ